MSEFSTVIIQGETYYAIQPVSHGICSGCAFDWVDCKAVKNQHPCYLPGDHNIPEYDVIYIPATDEALAKWVEWRMNGYPFDEEEKNDD